MSGRAPLLVSARDGLADDELVRIVGGKALNLLRLSEMLAGSPGQEGAPAVVVPAFFAVTTHAFELFTREADLAKVIRVRIQHLLCPMFNKGDSVLVRGSKFTILQQTGTGYVVTRCGKSFRLDASENIEPASVEIGDVVMAWYQPSHKRLPGICMGIEGKEYTIRFNGEIGQETCPSTGVRF